MKLNYKFFTIPLTNSNDMEDELNEFIKSHKIASIKKEFINNPENTCWFFLIEYLESENNTNNNEKTTKNVHRNSTDYREVLAPEIFSIYAKIREWRKKEAEKHSLQLYTILTNEQMAKIAENIIVKNCILSIYKSRVSFFGQNKYFLRKGQKVLYF